MDDSGNKALRDLGIFYCAVYVVTLAVGSLAMWLHWDAWRLDSLMPQLSNVITVSAGTALLASILKEGVWHMVLAGMKIRQWKEEGRAEGREEERERRRKRDEEALAKFGVEVNGVVMLPQTPEVQRFLAGEDEPESGR